MELHLKSVRVPAAASDGARLLVDRLWPRGMSKAKLSLTDWPAAVAPSTELRKWYGHEPSRWPEFQRRYRAELDGNDKAVCKLVDTLRRLTAQGSAATLLFGAHDEERNNAVVLRDYLLERMSSSRRGAPEDEGGAHAEVPTPRERGRKRTTARREEPAAAGRRKRTRRASGSE